MARQLVQRVACRLHPWLLGARAESTAVAPAAANAVESSTDAILQQLGPISDPIQERKLREAIEMPVEVSAGPDDVSESERAKQLELLRLFNGSLNVHGQVIRAKVLDMDRKKIVIDTGVKIAKIAHSDISTECIIGTTRQDDTPRKPGEVRVGDIVQVFLESMETPEGDMLVSGQQAAQERRFRAVWQELAERMEQKRVVQGRILNQLAGGYAVGVAGLVCFLPAQACHPATASRIGKLQDFYISAMNASRKNVVVRDVQFSRVGGGAGGRAAQQRAAAAKPAKPRGQEHPEQINQAALELRELLAGSKPQGQAAAGGAPAAAAAAEDKKSS